MRTTFAVLLVLAMVFVLSAAATAVMVQEDWQTPAITMAVASLLSFGFGYWIGTGTEMTGKRDGGMFEGGSALMKAGFAFFGSYAILLGAMFLVPIGGAVVFLSAYRLHAGAGSSWQGIALAGGIAALGVSAMTAGVMLGAATLKRRHERQMARTASAAK